jgi:hypothetical protein
MRSQAARHSSTDEQTEGPPPEFSPGKSDLQKLSFPLFLLLLGRRLFPPPRCCRHHHQAYMEKGEKRGRGRQLEFS